MRSDFFGPIIAFIATVAIFAVIGGLIYATHTERMACIAAGTCTVSK